VQAICTDYDRAAAERECSLTATYDKLIKRAVIALSSLEELVCKSVNLIEKQAAKSEVAE
jgi:hypothetical protein